MIRGTRWMRRWPKNNSKLLEIAVFSTKTGRYSRKINWMGMKRRRKRRRRRGWKKVGNKNFDSSRNQRQPWRRQYQSHWHTGPSVGRSVGKGKTTRAYACEWYLSVCLCEYLVCRLFQCGMVRNFKMLTVQRPSIKCFCNGTLIYRARGGEWEKPLFWSAFRWILKLCMKSCRQHGQ